MFAVISHSCICWDGCGACSCTAVSMGHSVGALMLMGFGMTGRMAVVQSVKDGILRIVESLKAANCQSYEKVFQNTPLTSIKSMEMTAVGEGRMAVSDQVMICFALIVDCRQQRLIVDGVFTCLHHKIMSSGGSHEFNFFITLLSTIGPCIKGM